MSQLTSALFLCLVVIEALANPAPGRIPKIYNALITSNQNLEPSKAFPVYQPVLQDTAYTFPFQPVYYGGAYPSSNGQFGPVQPPCQSTPEKRCQPAHPAESTPETQCQPNSEGRCETTPDSDTSTVQPPSTEVSTSAPLPPNEEPVSETKSSTAPPPPNTPSPIPLNEFGLPAQVVPLNRNYVAYNGVAQIGYAYPGLRLFDPYYDITLPLAAYPSLYGQLENTMSPSRSLPFINNFETTKELEPKFTFDGNQNQRLEPTRINQFNYLSQDPAIPNVPPPPLPLGGGQTECGNCQKST